MPNRVNPRSNTKVTRTHAWWCVGIAIPERILGKFLNFGNPPPPKQPASTYLAHIFFFSNFV